MEAWDELKENYAKVMDFGKPDGERGFKLTRLHLSENMERRAQLQGRPRSEALEYLRQLQEETLRSAVAIRNRQIKEIKHLDGFWFPQYQQKHSKDVWNPRHWRFWWYKARVAMSGLVNRAVDFYDDIPYKIQQYKDKKAGKHITLEMVFPDGIPFTIPVDKSENPS